MRCALRVRSATSARPARPAAPEYFHRPSLLQHASPLRRNFASSRHAREELKPSFKGQLYESTQQRLKRERAEQERFSQFQTQSPGGRYAAMMFGVFFFFS
jgi:D-lactate dehydrogenase (cytochrome)